MSIVAIVGGGFSGTITAVHLLKRGLGAGGRVIIINRSGAMARGVAYGTQSDRHVLNVPAGRMSAFEDEPDGFVEFVQRHGVSGGGEAFVSRHLYGAYLESSLNDAAVAAAAADVRLERVVAEVLAIEPASASMSTSDGTHATISLSDGSRLRADRVVLAAGNYPPAHPPIADPAFYASSARYVPDPWAPGALAAVDPNAPTLLLGTGLTMIDIVLELRALGWSSTAPSIAISRRGLLPLSHRDTPQSPHYIPAPPALDAGPPTIRAYLREVRRAVREAEARAGDWRDVIASLRPITPRLWQALPLEERARFLRHVRPFWEVHRHRLAPPLHEAFISLQRAGDLSIIAGRIINLRDAGDRVIATIRPRGADMPIEMTVGTVINCTGPAGNTRQLGDPLFQRLQARGLIVADPLGLGIETAASGAVIGGDGRASSTVFYVGPFLKARDWEATAVPELRRWARDVADKVIDSLRAAAPAPIAVRESTDAREPPDLPERIGIRYSGTTSAGVDISRETLEALVQLVQQAGRAILATMATGNIDAEIKGDGSPVTRADRAAHDIICRGLARLDSSIPIVSEEAQVPLPTDRSRWRRYWLVDPLDGTKEFLAGYPEFTVNIALIENGEPVLGVVGAPALQTVYFAGRCLGSWRRIGDEPDVRLSAHPPANGARIRIVESRAHPSPELERFLDRLQVGERIKIGSSLKFCRIAEGRADCYPRLGPTMAWDVAAGDCVFRNACDGAGAHASPLRYDPSDFHQAGFVIGFTGDGPSPSPSPSPSASASA